jgi:hypothetical protein
MNECCQRYKRNTHWSAFVVGNKMVEIIIESSLKVVSSYYDDFVITISNLFQNKLEALNIVAIS